MKDYQIRTTRVHVLPKGEPLFSKFATVIEIDDESGGEYLRITQQADAHESMEQQIYIDHENWDSIWHGIEMMLTEIKKNEKGQQP